MSIWGPGFSENDDAADWLATLDEAPSIELVREAIEEISQSLDTGYFEIPECCIAVAAADVLAETVGSPASIRSVDEQVLVQIANEFDRMERTEKKRLLADAIGVLELVLNDFEASELLQVLQDDAETLEAWRKAIFDLMARLNRGAMLSANGM